MEACFWLNLVFGGAVMFILAVLGLAVNISLFVILGGHHHGPFHSHCHDHSYAVCIASVQSLKVLLPALHQ